MTHARTSVRFGAWTTGLAAATVLALGCSDGQKGQTTASLLPANVQSIIFLQRVARNSGGNVFDYNSFVPGGRIVKLEPPAANGTLTNLTADPMFANADFMSWDLSFDAQTIVFSARLQNEDNYQLFSMNVDGTHPAQITTGPHDYVYPIFATKDTLLFTTNENVEVRQDPTSDSQQFKDEYERAQTAQVGTIHLDGSNEELGPRNVSHRVAPSLLPDGHVLYTEWRHLGEVNDGHLRMMNRDMTGMKEAFGGELKSGGTNSYLRGRYVDTYKTADGSDAFQIVAIGTSRDRTLQSGKLLLINLDKSEALSSYTDLTPLVPGGRTASQDGVGRYYDAEPVGSPAGSRFLVSWADGPVESSELALANTKANFGLYVFDASSGQKFPLFDDKDFWDIQARPVVIRQEPTALASPISGDGFVIGALNVYNTSLGPDTTGQVVIPPKTAVKARLIEGFSGEEGGISIFGSTEFDGQSLYGEVDVQSDGSFSAKVPANVPVHMQVIDKFGIALAEEPIWVSGRAGEQRTCGGCHESRSQTPPTMPGLTMAQSRPPVNLDVARPLRTSTNYTYGNVRGVPWDKAIQPIFDAKCISCHDGDATKPGNPTYTVTDVPSGVTQMFTFDLTKDKMNVMVGERMSGNFSKSYISVFGLGEMIGEHMVTYDPPTATLSYASPANAAGSEIIQRLNPPQRFPAIDTSVRRYPGSNAYSVMDPATKQIKDFKGTIHGADMGAAELTPDEYYILGLSIDMGGQFFSRENLDEYMATATP